MPRDLKVLLPVSLVLLFSILFGQSGTNTDLLHDQIDSLFNKEKYHEAYALIYPELEKCRQTENWKEAAYLSYYAAAAKTSLSQYDTCGLILEKDLQLFRAHQYTSHDVGDLYSFLGLNNVMLENYPAALDAYKEAISIFESLKEQGNSITFCNHNIAQIYLRRDDFPKAIFYLESALRTDTSGESHAATYGQLANCYHYMGDEKRVMEYCRKGFAVPHLTDIDKANLQSIAFTAWVAEGKMEEARKMLGEALAVYPKTRSFAIARIRVMTNLGVIYFKKGLIPQSDKIFAAAELEGKSYYQYKSREMAKLYVEWGDLYKKQGDNDRAMKYYQQALIQSWPDFNNPDINDNPVGQHPPIELWAMNAASRKAALLITQNKVTVADRIKAADCFDLAFAVAAQLRKVYERDETKLYFQQNNYNLRVEAVKNLWAIYSSPECVSKEEYLYRVFDLFESDRAATLRDALVRNNAMTQSGLPDSLRQQEENLRRDLALVQQSLKDAEIARDTAKIEKFGKLSFSQQREYDALLFRLEKQYPKFVEYKHADDFTPVRELQKSMSDTAVVLSWFDAGDQYFCVAKSRNETTGFVVDKDSTVNKSLDIYLKLLTNPDDQAADPGFYYSAARKLCQYFLPDQVLSGYKSITIIPDGLLCYIPFEALLTREYTGKYANAPYVLASHDIRYAWAASLLNDTRSERVSSGKMLFMAPFAQISRGNFPQLPNSEQERPEQLSDQSFSDASGTAAAFLQNAGKYNIVHLATHAHANENGGAAIEFADRAISSDEIFNYHFNASLVSLSACETGVGRYYTGEGVMSLARAFAYGGAKSLVASLWQVNDQSTSSVFKTFYQELTGGKTKSGSLREAKLAYLRSDITEAAKTPWHWAGFILLGKDDKLVIESGFFSGLPEKAIVFCGIALLLFLFFKRNTLLNFKK